MTVGSAVVVEAVLGDRVVESIVPKCDPPAVECDDIVGADHVTASLVNENANSVSQRDFAGGVRSDDISCDGIVALGLAA